MENKDLLKSILNYTAKNKFSDIHLNSNHFPIIRDLNWNLEKIQKIWKDDINILNNDIIKYFIKEISWENWYNKFIKNKELDTSISLKNWNRYRINCYMDTNWYWIALRLIPSEIPNLKDLWLWKQIEEMCNKNKWLILVTWPTWSGKSTNLAAMIDYINKKYKKHIITIEDPIEFNFKSDKSLINQREIWTNTNGFNEAMRATLRQDPDVIVIWEMRDPDTIKTAITMAETWHLVLSTLHTNDSVQTIDRIVDIFPWTQQKQIRMQLAMSLVWIISQKLIMRNDKDGRIASREILINNDAIKNLIITWKSHQVYSVLEVWQKYWMILMDKYLSILYSKGIINKETLISYARDKEWIEMLIS